MDTIGFAGGIWLLWRTESVTVDVLATSEQAITALVKRNTDANWLFSACYGSPNPRKREKLWEFLAQASQAHNSPWLVTGDFNEITASSEK